MRIYWRCNNNQPTVLERLLRLHGRRNGAHMLLTSPKETEGGLLLALRRCLRRVMFALVRDAVA
jgi:hypothetical protein